MDAELATAEPSSRAGLTRSESEGLHRRRLPLRLPNLHRWWSGLSLRAKLQCLIQAMLLLVLTVAQSWLMDRFKKHVLEAAERRAFVSADGVINGMNMLMVSHSISVPELRQLYIRKMAASAGILELRIVRAKQVQDQFGPGLPEEQVRDDLDRLAIQSAQPQFQVQEKFEALRAVVPFVASGNFRGTNCLQCHAVHSGSVNGAASITLSLADDYTLIRRIDRFMWIGQFFLQVVLFLLIGCFMRYVLRPLTDLQNVMTRIQKNADLLQYQDGALAVQIRHQDEIGGLAQAFNHMALTLQQKMQAVYEAREMQKVYLAQSLQEQGRMLALLSVMDIGILFVSRDNWIIHVNPAFFRIWELEARADLTASCVSQLFVSLEARLMSTDCNADRSPFRTPHRAHRDELCLANGKIVRLHSFEVSDHDCDGGGWLWLFEDVTEDRRNAEKLAFLAHHDPMTGLLNRRSFHENVTGLLTAADRGHWPVALLLLDLDRFKYVNDTFGHAAGDCVLAAVAARVGAIVRSGERLFRLGGDEFTILLPHASVHEASVLADRVIQVIGETPVTYNGNAIKISASVGIALYPHNGTGERELLAYADAAMYQAKEDGRNGWRLYDRTCDLSREMLSRISLEKSIDHAIRHGGLRLHFQGIYTVEGRLSHLEALVRMVDPDDPDKLISPATFIPVAERSGKIRAIDLWVLREVVMLLARSPQIPAIAVNVSGRTIDGGRLESVIRDEIARAGVRPNRLILELTETAAVAELKHLEDLSRSLQQAGLRICLDDFGSGFSSFTYLRHIDADILKIDGEFIRDLSRDTRSQLLVKAAVAVAQGLGKTTVAEFVEDEATLRLVADLGVDLVQGYLFDRPCADHPALAPATGRTLDDQAAPEAAMCTSSR